MFLVYPTRPEPPDPVTPPTYDTPLFDYEAALQACAAGNRQALENIYKQESRHLLGVALRIVRQRQQAEDVVHDAFMNIWTKAASFDASLGSGRGWIYSVVRNLALNVVRNGAREVSVDEETAEALDAQTSADNHMHMADAFDLRLSLGKLNDCLSRLEPARRIAFCSPMLTAARMARLPNARKPLWAPSRRGSSAVWAACGSAWHERA